VEGNLGRGHDDQPPSLVDVGQGGVGLHGAVGGRRQAVVVLFDELGLRESLLQLAEGDLHLRGQIPPRFVSHRDLGVILAAVEPLYTLLHGAPSVQQRFQDLVVHLDLLHRLPGCLQGNGRYQGDPVSHEAHPPVEEHRIVGGGFGIALSRGGVQDPGNVPVGEDVDNAVDGPGCLGIDETDLRVGVGGVEKGAVQRTFQGVVGGKQLLSRGQCQGVILGEGSANVEFARLGWLLFVLRHRKPSFPRPTAPPR
jgi:hypothetical protein